MVKNITFYDGSYYLLSNFSAYAVEYNGLLYPTAEHAYQAQKFTDQVIQEAIRQARNPFQTKIIAEQNKDFIRDDWEKSKLKVMGEILRCKLEQHEEVRSTLLSTSAQQLIDGTPTDYFWGVGKDKTGQNHLGKIWMRLRQELRSSDSSA